VEHLKLAFALEFIDSCGIRRSDIKFLRTDAIILSTPKRKMQLAKKGLVNVTRESLHKPKAWFFPRETVLEESAGQGEIFRVFDCKLPVQEKNGVLFDQKPRHRPHLMPPCEIFREGECDVTELALKLCAEKRRFCITGSAGCGKSTLVKKCLELLGCTVTARTHVACRQFDAAETLSRLKHRVQKGFFNSPLCVDEVFMAETALLDVLAKLSLHGNFMLLCGDDAQLPPIEVFDNVPRFLDSDLFKCLAPVIIELNVCKRSCSLLHDFNMLCRRESLEHCMAQARAIFQCEGEPDISLCCDNARRKQINEETNRRLAPESAQLLESSDGPILLHEGLPLVGCRIAHGILNAIWYTVESFDEHTLHLKDDRGLAISLSLEKAKSCLQLRYALTVHKSQSKTIL